MKITKSRLIQIIKEEVQLENKDREEVERFMRTKRSADEQERAKKERDASLNSAIEAVRDENQGSFESTVKELGYEGDTGELFASTREAFTGMIPFKAAKKHLEDKLS